MTVSAATTRAFLGLLGLLGLAELLVGLLIYGGLRADLERDLAGRLTQLSGLLANGVDGRLVSQLGAGDEQLPAYAWLRERLAEQARAAGLERAYVVDGELRVYVDSAPGGLPGRVRSALLASRKEAETAASGTPSATRLYLDEQGRLRLSAFARVPSAASPALLLGVDASPDFFTVLGALRRRMLLLGGLSLGIAALTVFVVLRLRQAEREARGNERLAALGGMAGAVLHEVRNPLAAITVYLDLLRAEVRGDEGRELAERALAEGGRLTGFLEDFQVFAGLRPPRREAVVLADLVTGGLRHLPWPEGVRLDRAIPAETRVNGDRRLLEHAVRNLLQNAVEALGGAPGAVWVRGFQQGAGVVLEVEDSGPGIPREQREKVFDPTFTTRPGGLGLGLTVVERVAEAHGGRVEVAQGEGGGALFRLRLPR